MRDDDRSFWMVWNPARGQPLKMHDSYASADAEAERLASKHAGEEFFVLQAVAKKRSVNVQTVVLHPDAPF